MPKKKECKEQTKLAFVGHTHITKADPKALQKPYEWDGYIGGKTKTKCNRFTTTRMVQSADVIVNRGQNSQQLHADLPIAQPMQLVARARRT